jgi:hypothetical protein
VRSVIKRDQVQLDETGARSARKRSPAAEPPAAGPCTSAPRVRLVQVDSHTQAIEFTCPCGEVSLIEVRSEKKP